MLVLNAIKTKNYTKTGPFHECEALAIGCCIPLLQDKYLQRKCIHNNIM